MKALAICSVLIFLGVASGYMNAYLGLLRIIKNEKPAWLKTRGSLDVFYQGLPQAGNPNIVAQVISVAFIRQLTQRAEKVVQWASIGEGLGILIAINVADNLGHPELKLAAIALVVGLHFLPMAYAIPFWQFYVLGAALVFTSILGMCMPQPMGSAFAVFMACVGLWMAALFAMRREVRGAFSTAAHS